jgi:hypothetical protein
MTQPQPEEKRPQPASAGKKKPRRWKRRGIIALIVLVGLAIIFRITLVLLLPSVINKVAHGFKLNAGYDRLDLSLSGGSAALWGFQLSPEEGGDPVFRADYLQGDISVLALLHGRLVVYRAAADGVDATLERIADGRVPLLERFASSSASTKPPPPISSKPNQPIDLEPPLRVDALRLEHVRARVHDLCVNPPIDVRLSLDFRISNLGNLGKPTYFELDFSSDPMLDSLVVEGQANGDAKQLTADLRVNMRGLHLKPAQGYLSALGLRAVADDISASMTGKMTAEVLPNPSDGIKADLLLDHARLSSDGREAAGMDSLAASVSNLLPTSIKISKVAIDGVRAIAGRNPDGSVAVAGIEIGAAPAKAPSSTSPPPLASVSPGASPATPASSFQWSLDQLALTNLHAGFVDEAVSPIATLTLDAAGIEVDGIDSSRPDTATKFSVALGAPGIVRQINVTGQAKPLSGDKTFEVVVNAGGINPTAIQPYLLAAGLASEWKDGSFSLSADGDMSLLPSGAIDASVKLTNLRLSDGADLLAMNTASIDGVELDPVAKSLRIKAINVSGPGLAAHRDAQSHLHFLGFRTQPALASAVVVNPAIPSVPAAPVQASTPIPPATQAAALPFEHIELDHFAWKDVHVAMTDDAVSPPATLAIKDAGVSVDNLDVHLTPSDQPGKQGTIRAWLAAPGLASNLSLDGKLTPSASESVCEFSVRGDDLRGDAVASYLKPLGIEPTLKDGSLGMVGGVTLDTSGSAPKISLSIGDLKYQDAGKTLASIAKVDVTGASVAPGKISLGIVGIQSPRARVVRRADGGLEAGGFHLIARPPAPANSAAVEPIAAAPPPAAPAAAASQPSVPPTVIAATAIGITDGSIEWIDQAVQPNVDTTLHNDTRLDDFEMPEGASPAKFHSRTTVDSSLDSLNIDGDILVTPTRQNANLTFAGQGMRAGPLAAYVPPAIHPTFNGASLNFTVNAAVAANPKGGQSFEVSVNNFKLQDSPDAPSLKFDKFHLKAPRLDVPGKVVAFDDFSLTGLETSATKSTDGITVVGAELFNNPPPAPPAVAPAPAPSGPAVSPSPSAAAAASSSQPSNEDLLRQIANQRGKFPLVTLQNLNLVTQKFTFTDATKPNAKPIVVSELAVRNAHPITLLGRDPESNPPAEIQVTGKIDPIADRFTVDTRATSFARQKNFSAELMVNGIHGSGLLAVDPELAKTIDADQLENGQFHVSALASLKLNTTLPTDFDFSHGGKLDFSVSKLAFRDKPDGQVLAGVGEIHSDGIILGPNFSLVEAKELEIDNIVGRATREHDGIHALGLIVKAPATQPAATQPVREEAQADAPATTAPSPVITADVSPAAASDSQKAASPTVKIDRVLISGIDCRVQDNTSDPPAIIPLNGLDVEAQNISTNPLPDDPPTRFNLLVSADKVAMPAKEPSEAADRELFSQVAGSGVVTLRPQLKGWTKLSVSGFELLGVRGIAKEEKVTVGGGTFDGDVDLRFPGDGTIDTSTRLVLTDLSLSEPPDGIIKRTLKLPAPLDMVIGALQDQDGSITIPLNFAIRQGQLNTASVVSASVGALAEIITTAIASAPLKLTGLLLGEKQNNPEPPTVVAFPAGYSSLGPDQIALLAPIVKHLEDNKLLRVTLKSDAGRDDVMLAGQRVNPAPDDALTLANALARRREALLAARQDATSQVRALLASTDSFDANRAIERLRTIDRELAKTETAMDSAYNLLRPGADRQAMRRTRAATLAIARAREDSVADYIENAGKHPIDPSRISRTNPQFVESPQSEDGIVSITVVNGH